MNTHTPPRPPFKVSGVATIRHLNVRKEGPEEEKIIAVDVKLQFSRVDRRLCAYFDDALESFLWRGDTDALIVRNTFLSPVVYLNEIGSATVDIGLHKFHGCEVKKFSIQPADGGVITLGCSVSLYPNASDVSDLAKIVQDDELVCIEGPPDLFDSQAAAINKTPDQVLDGLLPDADPMYAQAVQLVLQEQKASISMVQRHLKIGYNRAARLLEDMEKGGVVSSMRSNGSRDILSTEVPA